jgi:YegS/Rv2252/BmrU family lipid kinase
VRTFGIVNPVAGHGAAKRVWRQISAVTRSWDCATSEGPGHTRELAQTAVQDGYERVIAVGGDGTVSEAASGLAHSSAILGIVPAGTGNDIAHNLAIPRDALAAANLAGSAAPRCLDLCEVTTRDRTAYCLNVAGFGFDAKVARRVNHMPKLLGGTLPYVAGVLHTLWQYSAPMMRISIDDRKLERRVFLVAVGNCPTYGGGMRIVPAAQPDDGLLDVCVVNDLSRFEVLRILPRLYSGGHVSHPAVELFRCRSITADADGGVLCQADGELLGELPARFAVLPGALRCATGQAPGSKS